MVGVLDSRRTSISTLQRRRRQLGSRDKSHSKSRAERLSRRKRIGRVLVAARACSWFLQKVFQLQLAFAKCSAWNDIGLARASLKREQSNTHFFLKNLILRGGYPHRCPTP